MTCLNMHGILLVACIALCNSIACLLACSAGMLDHTLETGHRTGIVSEDAQTCSVEVDIVSLAPIFRQV